MTLKLLLTVFLHLDSRYDALPELIRYLDAIRI